MNYVLQDGAKFVPFWESLLRSRNRDILFVIGRGFDPRMCGSSRATIIAWRDGQERLRGC